jgi:uncharacterized membrane protein
VTRVASAGFAVALVALTWVLLHLGWYPHGQIVDYGVYRNYGDLVVHRHAVPYRDFRLEYPPGALVVFVLPAYLEAHDFRAVFQAAMIVCHISLVLAVLRVAGRRAAAFAAVAPLLLGSVVLSRFDLWPTALAGGALALLVLGSSAGAAVLLATSIAAKLWAAALAPLILIWIWRRDGRRRALEWLAATAAVVVAWFTPFVVASPGGMAHMFHEQLGRTLQVESLGASLLLAVHQVFDTSLGVVSGFGSQNVGGSGVGTVTFLTTVVEIVAVVVAYWLFLRGEPSAERLFLACAAVTASLIVFGKVFSPQFLIWLIPLVALVRRVPAWAVFALALVLTQAYFPRRYWHYTQAYAAPTALVLCRNLTLVALVGYLLYALSQGSTASSSERASSSVNARNGAQTSG